MRATSGAEALEILAQLRTRGDQVALLIADQRMPAMAGHGVPRRRRARSCPDAKRVLLTAYADTNAAIAAINEVGARLLPAQALGSARGAALPGARGPADDLGGRRGARDGRRAHHRPPLLQGLARPARLPGAQRRSGALARRRARRRGARAAPGDRRRRDAPAGRAARGRRGARAADRSWSSPSASASRRSRRRATTTS